MSTKTLNGSSPQAAEELIRKSADMPAQMLAEHNIMPAKASRQKAQAAAKPKTVGKIKKTSSANRYYETGIAINVSNGEKVVDFLNTFGPNYNPSNVAIQIPSLQALNIQAKSYIDTTRTQRQENTIDRNNRQDVYGDLETFARRVLNELSASGAQKPVIKNARRCIKDIAGDRIIPIDTTDPDVNYNSIHKTSFPRQIQHFTDLIGVVSACPEYDPNIPELKVVALETKKEHMVTTNDAANMSEAMWSSAMRERNQFFNAEYTGYVDIYLAVKRAVKATFGNSSPQYKQISGFTFRRIY